MTNTINLTDRIKLTETDNTLIFVLEFETEEQAFDLHKFIFEEMNWAISRYTDNILTVITDKEYKEWTIKEMVYRYNETI